MLSELTNKENKEKVARKKESGERVKRRNKLVCHMSLPHPRLSLISHLSFCPLLLSSTNQIGHGASDEGAKFEQSGSFR